MDDVDIELEAMEGVYGNEYKLLCRSPPCLQVLLKPRTADDISQQFVEATLVIQAAEQYPAVPPILELSNAKGLSEKRQADLMRTLNSLASKLSHEPMFLVISEAAMDWITSMNMPEDDCCFCLFPLVFDNVQGHEIPYMKLMSCFHCFHSDCFGSWWRWLQSNKYEVLRQLSSSSRDDMELSEGSSRSDSVEIFSKQLDSIVALCPVCRTTIHATDLAHVQEYLTTKLNGENEVNEAVLPTSIVSEERARQAQFAKEFAIQKARGGIIEPRKLEVLMPGMYLATPLQLVDVPAAEGTTTKQVEEGCISGTSNSGHIKKQTTNGLEPIKIVHRSQICHRTASNKVRVGRSSARHWHSHTYVTSEQDEGLQDVELRGPRKGKVWISRGKKHSRDQVNDM